MSCNFRSRYCELHHFNILYFLVNHFIVPPCTEKCAFKVDKIQSTRSFVFISSQTTGSSNEHKLQIIKPKSFFLTSCLQTIMLVYFMLLNVMICRKNLHKIQSFLETNNLLFCKLCENQMIFASWLKCNVNIC